MELLDLFFWKLDHVVFTVGYKDGEIIVKNS